MARKESTVAMGLVDLADVVETMPETAAGDAPKKRGRKPRVAKASGEPKGKTIVIVLDASTRGAIGAIANRLDRPITWVATRLLGSTVRTLADAGDDFLAKAESFKLR